MRRSVLLIVCVCAALAACAVASPAARLQELARRLDDQSLLERSLVLRQPGSQRSGGSGRKSQQAPPPLRRGDSERKEPPREKKDLASKCQLEWMSCHDVDQYLSVWSLSNVLKDIRRMETLKAVDPAFFRSSFSKTLEKIEKAVEWTTKFASIIGVPGIDDIMDVYHFIKDLHDNTKLIAELVFAQQYELAEHGARAHMSGFVEIVFGHLKEAVDKAVVDLAAVDKSPARRHRWLESEFTGMETKWIDAASKVACAADVALNNKGSKIGFWLAQIGLTIAGACGAAPVTVPIQIGLGATQLAGAGVAEANSYNFEMKMKYLMYKSYQLEALMTGEVEAPRSGASAARDAHFAGPTRCSLTDSAPNYGCPPEYWCQIEFAFVRNPDAAAGRGFCTPRFDGSHLSNAGAPCSDHSDCKSCFCFHEGRFADPSPRELALEVRKRRMVGVCREPSTDGGRLPFYTFKVKALEPSPSSLHIGPDALDAPRRDTQSRSRPQLSHQRPSSSQRSQKVQKGKK